MGLLPKPASIAANSVFAVASYNACGISPSVIDALYSWVAMEFVIAVKLLLLARLAAIRSPPHVAQVWLYKLCRDGSRSEYGPLLVSGPLRKKLHRRLEGCGACWVAVANLCAGLLLLLLLVCQMAAAVLSLLLLLAGRSYLA